MCDMCDVNAEKKSNRVRARRKRDGRETGRLSEGVKILYSF